VGSLLLLLLLLLVRRRCRIILHAQQ